MENTGRISNWLYGVAIKKNGKIEKDSKYVLKGVQWAPTEHAGHSHDLNKTRCK